MTAVIERENRSTVGDPKPAWLPTPHRTRRPLLAVASATLVLVSIAGFAELYASANRHVLVIVVDRTIEQGQRITGADLGTTTVDIAAGVAPVPVADASGLAGERAAVTIPAGSLLVQADLTDASPIGAGDAVVGLALKAGQLPASGVEPGDQVMIVQTGEPGTPLDGSASSEQSSNDPGTTTGGATASTGVLVPQADVFDVQPPPSDASSDTVELVSVEVASTEASAVTTAANADQVSLVLLPGSSSDGGLGTGIGS